MLYLLDTHIVLWWFVDPENINPQARSIIKDKSNTIFISAVSCWEMAIKSSIGRLNLSQQLLTLITQENFQLLPILPEETLAISDLPHIHSDPFDRLLIAQAKLHDLILFTRDEQIKKYPLVWMDA